MIGIPPSERGGRPADIAAHASQVAQEWEDVGERYVRRRMKELGIPFPEWIAGISPQTGDADQAQPAFQQARPPKPQ